MQIRPFFIKIVKKKEPLYAKALYKNSWKYEKDLIIFNPFSFKKAIRQLGYCSGSIICSLTTFTAASSLVVTDNLARIELT